MIDHIHSYIEPTRCQTKGQALSHDERRLAMSSCTSCVSSSSRASLHVVRQQRAVGRLLVPQIPLLGFVVMHHASVYTSEEPSANLRVVRCSALRRGTGSFLKNCDGSLANFVAEPNTLHYVHNPTALGCGYSNRCPRRCLHPLFVQKKSSIKLWYRTTVIYFDVPQPPILTPTFIAL